jgi:hypothetical protein
MGLRATITIDYTKSPRVSVSDVKYVVENHRDDIYRLTRSLSNKTRTLAGFVRVKNVSYQTATALSNYAKANPRDPDIQQAIRDGVRCLAGQWQDYSKFHGLDQIEGIIVPSDSKLPKLFGREVFQALKIKRSEVGIRKKTIGEAVKESRNRRGLDAWRQSVAKFDPMKPISNNRHILKEFKPAMRWFEPFILSPSNAKALILFADDDARTRYTGQKLMGLLPKGQARCVVLFRNTPTCPHVPFTPRQKQIGEMIRTQRIKGKHELYDFIYCGRGSCPGAEVPLRKVLGWIPEKMEVAEVREFLREQWNKNQQQFHGPFLLKSNLN